MERPSRKRVEFAFGLCHVTFLLTLFRLVTAQNETCPSTCQESDVEKNCFCDQYCHIYNDCCKNHEVSEQHDPKLLAEYRKSFRCSDTVLPAGFQMDIGVAVITSCPAWSREKTLISRCQSSDESHVFLFIPVTSRRYGVVYKNVYCGMCWGDTEILYWNINSGKLEADSLAAEGTLDAAKAETFGRHVYPGWVTLIKHFSLNESILNDLLYFSFKNPSDTDLRDCDRVISHCPAGTCDTYTSYVYTYVHHLPRGVKYRNPDCARCNNVTEFHCSLDDMGYDFGRDLGAASIVALFDLNKNGPGVFAQQCARSEIYDPLTKICRTLYCETLQGKTDKICSGECDYVVLDSWEYLVHENDTAYLKRFGVLLKNGDFRLKNRSLLICERLLEDLIRDNFPFTSAEKGKWIFSLTGQILCMVSLVAHFIASLKFQSLRRIPASKAIMSLDVSLFLGQIHLIIGSMLLENFLACKIFGILVHYYFLVSFTWMSVLAFDLASTFATTNMVTRDYKHATRRFVYYSIYAWTSPLAVVTISIVFDEMDAVPFLRPLYGKYVCWFGNPSAQLIFFLVPVALVLVANMSMYSMTLYGICTVQRQTKMARKRDKCFLLIYFKLFFIMGLTWLFGFIGTVSNSEPIWYFFIFLNSTQGVFICFAFLCRRSVRSQMSDSFRSTSGRVVYRRANSGESTGSKRNTQTSGV